LAQSWSIVSQAHEDQAMSEEFENQLRKALRPVEAPEGFAERLMQRLPPPREERREPVVVALPRRAPSPARRYGLPAALAASLVAAVFLGQQLADRRFQNQIVREQAEGLAAKQELLQALRVTSQKLDMAYEAVSNPPTAGEEENRS
jgi:hypothetical protein